MWRQSRYFIENKKYVFLDMGKIVHGEGIGGGGRLVGNGWYGTRNNNNNNKKRDGSRSARGVVGYMYEKIEAIWLFLTFFFLVMRKKGGYSF